MTPDQLAVFRRLSAQWREKNAAVNSYHATMGIGWAICANELDKAVAGLLASPQDVTVETRINLGLRLGQILGPDYDGVSLEDIARELVALKVRAADAPAPKGDQHD